MKNKNIGPIEKYIMGPKCRQAAENISLTTNNSSHGVIDNNFLKKFELKSPARIQK